MKLQSVQRIPAVPKDERDRERERERERLFFHYIIEQTYDVGLHSRRHPSMQAQGLSHHLMRRTLSQEEGERGEYVCVYAYLHVSYLT